MITVTYILGLVFALEISLAAGTLWLRKSCPWLITRQDAHPKLDPRGLDSFLKHGWDSELGWIRKPNTSGAETGRNNVSTAYHIDASGARLNPSFEDQPPVILAYGDSYTFARQVDDDETWAHYLSKTLSKNVANYGVGNYGFDQALLRLEREYPSHPAPVVVIGVVPETIARIHAYWKHYSEYGNTFAFKPRFVLESGELSIKPNLINTVDKFGGIEVYLQELAEYDYFHKTKFTRDMLMFPYCISVLKNPKRTFKLMLAAFTDRLGITNDAAFLQVMRRNIQITRTMYRNPEGVALFAALVQRFVTFCTEQGSAPILLMIPQRMDIERIQNGDHYYQAFIDAMSKHLTVIDAAPALLHEPDLDGQFINDQYGGHLSAAGNKLVAHLLEPACRKLLQTAPYPSSSAQRRAH